MTTDEDRSAYNQYMKEYMREYSAKRRLKALAILGDKCSRCGNTKLDELDIHHVDPKTKSFTLGSGWHHAWSKILTELKKCEILCEPCHTDEHRSKALCGTVQRYWRGCRCDLCRKAKSEQQREYMKEYRRRKKEQKGI